MIGLTIKNTLIQADCQDADTISQMTDLRSLDSAPDSQFDFGELNKNTDEKSAQHESKMDPAQLLKRDKERQKKGLPPMFGGASGKASGFNISSDQFSLKSKAATSTMSGLSSGPVKPNKLPSKDDIQETPEKMDDCDVTSEEEGNISKTPASFEKINKMPDTSEFASDSATKSDKKKVIKSSAISKIRKRSKKRDEGDSQTTAFTYNESKPEEDNKFSKRNRLGSSDEDPESQKNETKQIYDEVKDLRQKIRKLEKEKQNLQEEVSKAKQDAADELRHAIGASESDDKKVEILQHTVDELEGKKDKLELTINKKDNEIEKLNKKLEDKDIDIGHMKDKRKELENKIKEADEKTKKLSIELKEYREQMGNFEQENVSLKKEIDSLNTYYNRMKDENQELSDNVAKLREQLENRRDSAKNSSGVDEEEFNEYKSATEALISDYKAQIKDLERKNDELNSDNDKITQEKEESESTYSAKLKEANSQIDILQQSESSLKSQINELEQKVEDLMQERLERERNGQESETELKGKYKSLEIKYNQINSKLEDREEIGRASCRERVFPVV